MDQNARGFFTTPTLEQLDPTLLVHVFGLMPPGSRRGHRISRTGGPATPAGLFVTAGLGHGTMPVRSSIDAPESPMSRRAEVVVVVLILLVVGGLVTVFVNKVRDAAGRIQCQNNLKQLGCSVQDYGSRQ